MREPGSRTKIAVASVDPHVDPVGSLVGQRGVRVATVMSQLGGERIDIVDFSEDARAYIREALSPAEPMSVDINEADHRATVTVAEDEQSLAIGRGGQNVRLAAKLTGWNIDIVSGKGEEVAESDGTAVVVPDEAADVDPSDPDAPAKEAGVDPGEAPSVVGEAEPIEETATPAEEELTENPDSSETAAEAKDDRDPAKDDQ